MNNIYRTLSIETFGTWNCDQPVFIEWPYITVQFKTENNSELLLDNITVIDSRMNGAITYYHNRIQLDPDEQLMIWGTKNGKFYYLTYNEYNQCNLSNGTKGYTFTMHSSPHEINSPKDIQDIVEL